MKVSFAFLLSILIFLHSGASPLRPLPDELYPRDPDIGERPRDEELIYSLGSGKTERFSEIVSSFSPKYELSRLVRLRLVGVERPVKINEVRIFYTDNSEEIRLPILEGELGPGEIRWVSLSGRSVTRIDVSASSFFWKRSGAFRVDVTAVR